VPPQQGAVQKSPGRGGGGHTAVGGPPQPPQPARAAPRCVHRPPHPVFPPQRPAAGCWPTGGTPSTSSAATPPTRTPAGGPRPRLCPPLCWQHPPYSGNACGPLHAHVKPSPCCVCHAIAARWRVLVARMVGCRERKTSESIDSSLNALQVKYSMDADSLKTSGWCL